MKGLRPLFYFPKKRIVKLSLRKRMQKSSYTVTAALPYANGPLHLGHIAGVYLPADIFVRFLRLMEQDVLFICGSDEHGAAITLRAKKEGISPQEIVDKYHHLIEKTFADFGIGFDVYHRTSDPLHHKTSSDFFKVLHEKGVFTQEVSNQFYDQDFEQFLADRYITGTCPKCQFEGAYGDQCERCGTDLSPSDLINPLSTLSGKTPQLKETSHWFLPMNEHETWLTEWIQKGILEGVPQHDVSAWKNQVIGQCMSWINAGLKPRAMTRDLDWGVPVPLPNAEGKVLYVWLDAPIGYISATKAWAEKNGKDWKSYWGKTEASERKLVHFIGKDNIVFHAIIFPILLKAHGNFILPDNVPAYEFLNLEGDKFSTSRNWAVWLHEYLAEYPSKVDELKYVLTSIAPENKDAEFTWADYQVRINSELADILGNFVNRTVVLTHKYYEGQVPPCGPLMPVEEALQKKLREIELRIIALLTDYKIREAQQEMMGIARLGNKYLADEEPWKKIKTDPSRVPTILYTSIHITRELARMAQAFLPNTAAKIYHMLNLPNDSWSQPVESLPVGHVLNPAVILFEKITDEVVAYEKAKLIPPSPQSPYPMMKDLIPFDDFVKMDIRLGTVKQAQKMENADKLLLLTVDTGIDERTIVSGIAQHYTPEEMVNKTVVVLMNLAPRKIRGVESNGMLLMAEDHEGKLSALVSDKGFEAGPTIG
ncbi:MAG: methionine--tRNA ligase [Flavobacteriales bacterium]